MASKRAIRRKACAGKNRYATHHDASKAIYRLQHSTAADGMLVAYACQFCGGFHFGHPPARVRQAIARRLGPPCVRR